MTQKLNLRAPILFFLFLSLASTVLYTEKAISEETESLPMREFKFDPETSHKWRSADDEGREQLRKKAFFILTPENGSNGDKEITEALTIISEIASAGDPDVQLVLAELYLDGKYLQKDPVYAAYWFERASELGSLLATDGAIALHSDKQGGRYNPQLVEHYRKHREELVAQDTVTLLERAEVLRELLQNPETTADDIPLNEFFQVTNFLSLYALEKPDPKVSNTTIELLQLADAKGYFRATYVLANYYERGTLIEQDLEKRHAMLLRAANAGDQQSAEMVGDNFADSKGAPRDLEKAREYYLQAQALGEKSRTRRRSDDDINEKLTRLLDRPDNGKPAQPDNISKKPPEQKASPKVNETGVVANKETQATIDFAKKNWLIIGFALLFLIVAIGKILNPRNIEEI